MSFFTMLFFQVGSGKEVRISTENIIVSDPDTPSHELIVKILRKPSHGNIINKKTEGKKWCNSGLRFSKYYGIY